MKSSRILVYATLVAVVTFTVGQFWPELVGRAAYAVESGQAAAAREQLKHARDLSTAFQDVTKSIRPAVVNIRSIRKIEADSRVRSLPFPGQSPLFNSPFGDDMLERFFGQRFNSNSDSQQFVQRGLGTGVIVSQDGYIITNNHVVEGASDVTVTLSDNRAFEAKVIGTDTKTDLAILKIDAPELMAAQLGDSEDVNVGEWVLAMGSPFGLDHTVTAGIISAKGRSNVGIADYEDFIQTDAAINPGNSGGPLLNLDGQVIGINTAIATNNGSYQGIGFAIPMNMVKQVMEAIIDDGKVTRGWLGVTIQDLTDDLAASFDYEEKEGVLIGDIIPDGPADQAGLKSGDIIVSYDGNATGNMNHLRNQIAATAPGKKVDFEIFRDGRSLTKAVEIGELDSQVLFTRDSSGPKDLGMQIQTITPEIARQLRLKHNESGVVVSRIEPGGMAEKAGLRVGDVVIAAGDERIDNVNDFRKALSELDLERGVRLRIKTDGMQRFVFLKR